MAELLNGFVANTPISHTEEDIEISKIVREKVEFKNRQTDEFIFSPVLSVDSSTVNSLVHIDLSNDETIKCGIDTQILVSDGIGLTRAEEILSGYNLICQTGDAIHRIVNVETKEYPDGIEIFRITHGLEGDIFYFANNIATK